jgi:hypothetical protein
LTRSKYKYLGVYQEDGSWQAHAQRRSQRCKQPMGTGGQLQQSADKGQTAHGSDLHLFRGHGAEVWDTTKAVKDKMSAVVKKALRILALHPRDCSSDVHGDTGLLPPGVLIDAAKLCWQHRCQNMEAGRWPKEALRFSFEGSRGVGRPGGHGLVR